MHSNSGANHAVVNAHNDRSCLGPIETCYPGPEVALLHTKTKGGVLDPLRLVILVLKSLFCMYKTTGVGWNQYSLFILVLRTLLRVLKTTDEDWDPYRLVSLVIKSLFCMEKKNTDESWNPYRLVIVLQIMLFCIHKTTGYVWDS